MSVVRTEDKYLCDACGEEYIGPPTLYDNQQKTDMDRTVCIAVFDQDCNRHIGTRLYFCAACSNDMLYTIKFMKLQEEPPKPKRKWWKKKEVVG